MDDKKIIEPNGKTAGVSATTLNTENGWDECNGQWYYYINGQMQTGWVKDSNGNWVYLQANGVMVSSQWIEDKGLWYYLNSSGIMEVNSWVKDSKDGNWYYVGPNGAMEVSTTIDGYNLGPNGVATKIPVNSPYNPGEDDSITTELIAYQRFAREFGLKETIANTEYKEIIPISTGASIIASVTIGDILTTGNTLCTLNLNNGNLIYNDNIIDTNYLKVHFGFSLPNGKSVLDMVLALPNGKIKVSYDLNAGYYITIISNLYSDGSMTDQLSVKFGIQIIPGDNPDYGDEGCQEDDPNISPEEANQTLQETAESSEDEDGTTELVNVLGCFTAALEAPAPVSAIKSLKNNTI